MQSAHISRPAIPPVIHAAIAHRESLDCLCRWTREASEDLDFVMMLDAYREGGGLARADELQSLFRRNGGPDVAGLARWIVERRIVCFDWQAQTWIPLFQFKRLEVMPDPRLDPILAELNPSFDQWEVATWLARPNPWLLHRAPVQTLDLDYPAVLDAARADGFITN